MKRFFINNSQLLVICLTLLIFLPACQKFANPAPIFEDYGTDTLAAKTRKVLIIGIDGFSGTDLQATKPAFLDSVMQHSKYSYSLLKEGVNNDVSAWKSMATGTSYATHLTSDSSFTPIGDQNDPDGALPDPNNMFYYFVRYKPLEKSLLITPWSNLANLLLKGASKTVIASDDKVVRDSAVNLLVNSNSSLNIINFNEIALAGKQNGFDVQNAAYKSAVGNVDGYIKDVMTAIKSRKTYNQENWLVMIASNRGPDGLNPNEGFLMAYNDNFTSQEVKKNGAYAPYINYSGTTNNRYTIPDDQGLYNFGAGKSFTVQFTINVSSAALSFPFLFGKKLYQGSGASANGWVFYLGYDLGWSMDFGAKRSSGYRLGGTPYTNTINMRNGTWYTITAVVERDGNGQMKVRGYTYIPALDTLDVGAWVSKADLGDAVNTNAPLTIGHMDGSQASDEGGSAAQFNIRNIKIFDIALDSATIANTTCLQDMTQHPDYNHLIGYWPCDDGAGTVIRNYASNGVGYDFMEDGGYSWNLLDNTKLPCSIPGSLDPSAPSVIAQNADIATNALFWLRLDIKDEWNMEGQSWIHNFEIEYVQ